MGFKEGYLEYPDGLKIRYRLNGHNKGTVAVFIHGAGERLETYDYIFPYFETAGISLNALELRGHGLSGGSLSGLRDFSPFEKDLKRFIFGHLQNRQVFLVAHGAGALLAVRIASDPRFSIKGIVLVSPLFEGTLPPPRRFSISFLASFLPGIFIPSPVAENVPCEAQDPAAAPLKRADGFPAGFIRALFNEMKRSRRDLSLLRNFPVLLVVGEEDTVIDIPRTAALFKSVFGDSQNLKVVSCRKCGHLILVDKERLDFVEKIIRWIHRIETGQP